MQVNNLDKKTERNAMVNTGRRDGEYQQIVVLFPYLHV